MGNQISNEKIETYRKRYNTLKNLRGDVDKLDKEMKKILPDVKEYYKNKLYEILEEMTLLGLTVYVQDGEEFLKAKKIADVNVCCR